MTVLDSNTLDVFASAAGVLDVWVTSLNNSAPTGPQGLLSSFTSNLLPAGWSVTESIYLTNTLWGTTTTLGKVTLTSDTTMEALSSQTLTAPYAITELYAITATGAGVSNLTIDVSAVPGPTVGAGLPGLILAGGFLFAWRQNRRARRDASAMLAA